MRTRGQTEFEDRDEVSRSMKCSKVEREGDVVVVICNRSKQKNDTLKNIMTHLEKSGNFQRVTRVTRLSPPEKNVKYNKFC